MKNPNIVVKLQILFLNESMGITVLALLRKPIKELTKKSEQSMNIFFAFFAQLMIKTKSTVLRLK